MAYLLTVLRSSVICSARVGIFSTARRHVTPQPNHTPVRGVSNNATWLLIRWHTHPSDVSSLAVAIAYLCRMAEGRGIWDEDGDEQIRS